MCSRVVPKRSSNSVLARHKYRTPKNSFYKTIFMELGST